MLKQKFTQFEVERSIGGSQNSHDVKYTLKASRKNE